MDWEAVGAVGEVGGAVAVVVTLIFLVRQIRDNTRSTNASAHSERTNRNIDLALWSGDNGIGEIRRKLAAGSEISEREREILFVHDMAVLRHFEDLHFQRGVGLIDDETWAANLSGITRRARSPGFDQTFERGKYGLRSSFRALLEESMANSDRAID